MLDLARLAQALGGEVSNGQVLAPGPGHSPKDRSLSVKLEPDAPEGFVVFSFAGDDPIACRDHVRAKAGLPPWKPNGHKKPNGNGAAPDRAIRRAAASNTKQRRPPLGPIVAISDFTDEKGVLLYQEVRYADPKDFRIRRPNGKGGWIWSKGNHEVPYRLPEILEAIAQGSPIAIVEGCKDCDALWEIGIPATTNANGARNTKGWRDKLRVHFRGVDVIMTPDNDSAGFKYIADVGAGLTGVAKRIRVLMLPGLTKEGADTSDWLEAGGTAEQWRALAELAPDWVPPAPSVDAVDEEAKAAAAAREKELIDELASISPTEYDRRRRAAASELGVRSSTLDSERDARRAALEAERKPPPLYGHWLVEPWPEEVDGDALIQSIVRRVRSHVVLTADQALASALWTMMGWVHQEAAVHSPILLATSPEPNSGKTTLANVVMFLVPRGLSTVGTTGAVLYRMIQMYEPTIVVDEADTALVENDDLRAIINSGWTRGSGVPRCVGDNSVPTLFSTFGPKMLAMKGLRLPDTTLSRCIIIDLKRRKPIETVVRFKHIDDEGLADLRRQALRWSIDNVEALKVATPTMPDGFDNRVGDNWHLLSPSPTFLAANGPRRRVRPLSRLPRSPPTNSPLASCCSPISRQSSKSRRRIVSRRARS
jgi:hypothetical protein